MADPFDTDVNDFLEIAKGLPLPKKTHTVYVGLDFAKETKEIRHPTLSVSRSIS